MVSLHENPPRVKPANMMTEVIKRVEALVADTPEPRELYWLVIGGLAHPFVNYCHPCAHHLVRWMKSIAPIPEHRRGVACLQTGIAAPRQWGDEGPPDMPYQTDPGEIYYSNDIGAREEYDDPERCGVCSCQLQVWLTASGVESEIDHFEAHPPKSPRAWRDILNVCESLGEIAEEGDDLYSRVLAAVIKFLPASPGAEEVGDGQ